MELVMPKRVRRSSIEILRYMMRYLDYENLINKALSHGRGLFEYCAFLGVSVQAHRRFLKENEDYKDTFQIAFTRYIAHWETLLTDMVMGKRPELLGKEVQSIIRYKSDLVQRDKERLLHQFSQEDFGDQIKPFTIKLVPSTPEDTQKAFDEMERQLSEGSDG